MKKTTALLLALLLLAGAPLALADTVRITENASGFDLTLALPADAAISENSHDNVPYTFITFEDAAKPSLYISVAPNEKTKIISFYVDADIFPVIVFRILDFNRGNCISFH